MMTRILACLHFCVSLAIPSAASAGDRYALIIAGASGGPQYTQRYQALRKSLVATLRQKFGYADDHLIMLAEAPEVGVRSATRDNVRGPNGYDTTDPNDDGADVSSD